MIEKIDKNHKTILKGDIVLLKEINVKPNHYPMGIVKETVTNDNGEVTGALVLKGKTREIIKRHSSTLIPLLRVSDGETMKSENNTLKGSVTLTRPSRKAANISREKTRALLE